jgi:heat shock protein HslJ
MKPTTKNFLILSSILLLFNCCEVTPSDEQPSAPGNQPPTTEQPQTIIIGQTWVLIEKVIDGVKEKWPEDDTYPVTLTFRSDTTFHGRHDANSYDGKYTILVNNFSVTEFGSTDCWDIEWYRSYLEQLRHLSNITLTDSTLLLSNRSLILSYITKEKFERDFFKLEDWYNY